MKYECFFDFTICKPKKSQFIGKSGVIEFNTDAPLSSDVIDDLKNDESFLSAIACDLNKTLKQKKEALPNFKGFSQTCS
jgi:hypothetical protein